MKPFWIQSTVCASAGTTLQVFSGEVAFQEVFKSRQVVVSRDLFYQTGEPRFNRVVLVFFSKHPNLFKIENKQLNRIYCFIVHLLIINCGQNTIPGNVHNLRRLIIRGLHFTLSGDLGFFALALMQYDIASKRHPF